MAGREWGEAMRNVLEIEGHKAVVSFDPEIEMFRGEFLNLSGGADFHGRDVESLRKEGAISLRVYLEACQKKGVEPYRNYSGRLNVRFPPELHERLASRRPKARA